MKEIVLPNKNLITTIDDADYDLVKDYHWYAHKSPQNKWYAAAVIRKGGKSKFVYLHRFIMGFPKGKVIDHINGNTLINERWNLRVCTRAENNRNVCKKKKRVPFASQYKGVYWRKDIKKWEASIRYRKKQIHIGFFSNEKDAAYAYDDAAKTLFCNFAKCNFPKQFQNREHG